MEGMSHLVYYIGADGPTVIIAACNKDWLHYFKELLVKLKNGTIDRIDFTKLENADTMDLARFTLTKAENSKDSGMDASHLEDKAVIEWRQTEYEIETLISLTDGLLKPFSGHHFFNLDSDDDVLIVLSSYQGRIMY